MNKKLEKQIEHVTDCVQGHTSVRKLCEKLKVSESGLGHRLIALQRAQYNERIKDDV